MKGGASNHGRRGASRSAARMLLTGRALVLVFGPEDGQQDFREEPYHASGAERNRAECRFVERRVEHEGRAIEPRAAACLPSGRTNVYDGACAWARFRAWAPSACGVVGSQELIGRLIPITGDPIERRSVDLRVVFRKNSAELGGSAVAQLRELGEALVSEVLREVPIGIYGHTDTGGPADFNQDLSERRAQAVAAWLREHFDIPEARYREVRGYGEERPRGDLSPADPAQRRVEIVTFHDLASDAEREVWRVRTHPRRPHRRKRGRPNPAETKETVSSSPFRVPGKPALPRGKQVAKGKRRRVASPPSNDPGGSPASPEIAHFPGKVHSENRTIRFQSVWAVESSPQRPVSVRPPRCRVRCRFADG